MFLNGSRKDNFVLKEEKSDLLTEENALSGRIYTIVPRISSPFFMNLFVIFLTENAFGAYNSE